MTRLSKYEELCKTAKATRVWLYCNPATSEVTAEYPTLHDAMDESTPSTAGALLVCNGVMLATAVARGWLLEQPGIERLLSEFKAEPQPRESILLSNALFDTAINALQAFEEWERGNKDYAFSLLEKAAGNARRGLKCTSCADLMSQREPRKA